ncbi:hypothetical protein ACHAXA_008964 [Cyclostephanos tholiformis]|uniref:MYND-type domain-containing protein n=1 Tax=Cyclostephanos tholiformis TaxID=382380 RepID=A0ABD3SBR3_9STRA
MTTTTMTTTTTTTTTTSTAAADETVNRCAVCNMPSHKRCQRCKSAWYCDKEHQVSHWRAHRSTCDDVVSAAAAAAAVDDVDIMATSQALQKLEFDRIRLRYGLDRPDKAEIIAEMLSRDDQGVVGGGGGRGEEEGEGRDRGGGGRGVSASDFANMFGMTTKEAVVFLEWIKVGVKFKEEVLDNVAK